MEKLKLDYSKDELFPPAYLKLHRDVWANKYTHYILEGGRGSCKSTFVSIEVILLLTRIKNIHAIVFRKVGRTLRHSVYAQYLWTIEKLGLKSEFNATVTPLEIEYKLTGQKIMFFGADDKDKLKSIKASFGYFAITHFEEKDQFAGREEIRSVLQSTMRGGSLFWNFETNNPPVSLSSWTNRDSLIKEKGRVVHKSDYRNVPREWLGESFFIEAEALKKSNPLAYEHEYLGKAVGCGNLVFNNIVPREISNEEIDGFERTYMGIDWGYYPDPFVWNRLAYNSSRQQIFIFDELCCYRASNFETAAILVKEKGVLENELIIADSAERKSIDDYRDMGLFCKPARKGRGSVAYSTKWLQGQKEIVIDPVRCPGTYGEFSEYEYLRNREGEVVEGLPDKNNHHIDAVRYAFSHLI